MYKHCIRVWIVVLLCLFSAELSAATVMNAQIFALPDSEYTHIMIETNKAASHSMILLKKPDRVVLDIKNININQSLINLSTKDFRNNSSVRQARIGTFKAGVTRIVFDVKTEVKAVLNVEKPKDNHLHRLALDFYPIKTKQFTLQQPTAASNTSAKDLSEPESKSSGAKIILEPNYGEDDMQMEEDEEL